MGPGTLENLLKDIPFAIQEDILVGMETRDDAAVYRINTDTALVQTIDFFTPMVDDPYLFGQIAATNAINDIYAMGGRPLLALNIVCYPVCEDLNLLGRILQGGLDKIMEAGAFLLGGHSVDDNEPKYGLAVTGLVHPDRVLTNAGAKPGDRIYITKPIGNGIIATAIKAEMASEAAYDEAVHWMTMLNRESSEAALQVGVHAMTDVTGFGLLGHLYEMARASEVTVQLYTARVPLIKGAWEGASMGLIPAGAYGNRAYLEEKIALHPGVDPTWQDLFYTPETAGGLLIAVGAEEAPLLEAAMKRRQIICAPIGEVMAAQPHSIKIRP